MWFEQSFRRQSGIEPVTSIHGFIHFALTIYTMREDIPKCHVLLNLEMIDYLFN
jgi:hypothetical protein